MYWPTPLTSSFVNSFVALSRNFVWEGWTPVETGAIFGHPFGIWDGEAGLQITDYKLQNWESVIASGDGEGFEIGDLRFDRRVGRNGNYGRDRGL